MKGRLLIAYQNIAMLDIAQIDVGDIFELILSINTVGTAKSVYTVSHNKFVFVYLFHNRLT